MVAITLRGLWMGISLCLLSGMLRTPSLFSASLIWRIRVAAWIGVLSSIGTEGYPGSFFPLREMLMADGWIDGWIDRWKGGILL
jgi:hypothetical protein